MSGSDRTRVTLLGSTGSIGTQGLQVVSAHPDRFEVTAIAGGSNHRLLAQQAVRYTPSLVAAATGTAEDLTEAIGAAVREAGVSGYAPEVIVGPDAATQVAGAPTDVVLNGITGAIGLRPTLAALRSGVRLALANKESLIIGGPIVAEAATPGQIVPVDSEHSAIAQALRSGARAEVRKLIVTASGGPFRGMSRAELREVTPEAALQHPNFAMGRVITTNSATLVNKGLELIEAHLLFDVPMARIEAVVHPQQIIHSMVEFHDGAVVAQLGLPTMLAPIALGLSWPDRLTDVEAPVDWTRAADWRFEPLDAEAFPAVRLAQQVGEVGGTHPAVYNAANEVGVDAFHEGACGFLDIVDTISEVVSRHEAGDFDAHTVEGVLAADEWARSEAAAILGA
ncbi:1-deoxy-D-xylulose-5-phosphate reductoisomerase [Janibacter alittae]|uniref:1-deoxy-D-xylulose 5-phosphate reductoisomerase n=1 Tax=Janibacter alittae TaxID=3115209 RepID=A0ABZ2MK67_9MICO